MPAADLMTYLPQLVWFYVIFFIFMVFMRGYILPAMNAIFITRRYVFARLYTRKQILQKKKTFISLKKEFEYNKNKYEWLFLEHELY